MTPTPIMWALASSDERMATVRLDGESDELYVTWLCGEKHAFTRELLERAIAHVEDLAPLDVWLRMRDVDEDDFVVKVTNGRLQAKGGAFSSDTGDVEWSELRELIAPPPAMGTPYEPEPAAPSRLRRLLRR